MRAVRLMPQELKKYNEELIAQANKIKKILYEIAIYSNGAITLQDLYNMAFDEIKPIEEILMEKIKSDNNIVSKQML